MVFINKRRLKQLRDLFNKSKTILFNNFEDYIEKQDLIEKAFATTRVNHYFYYLVKIHDLYDEKIKCMAVPKREGDFAFSHENWSSYRMTHGGITFREAAKLCEEVAGNW